MSDADETPPEPTLVDVNTKVENLARLCACILLAITQYPMQRELLLQLIKANGVEIDESVAFRPRSIIQAPGDLMRKQ